MKCSWRISLGLALSLVCLAPTGCGPEETPADWVQVEDEPCHFAVSVPGSWTLKRGNSDESRLRLFASQSEGHDGLAAFCWPVDGTADVNKFAERGNEMLGFLGPELEESETGWNSITKHYAAGKSGQTAHVAYYGNLSSAVALVAVGESVSEQDRALFFGSFDSRIGWWPRITRLVKGMGVWLIASVLLTLFVWLGGVLRESDKWGWVGIGVLSVATGGLFSIWYGWYGILAAVGAFLVLAVGSAAWDFISEMF